MGVRWRWTDGAGGAPASALNAIEVWGDEESLQAAWSAIVGGPLPSPGHIRWSPLPGPDDGLAMRASESLLLLFPHGGAALRANQDAALRTQLGNPWDDASSGLIATAVRSRFPEARSLAEACALDSLSHTAGARSVDALLRQHELWHTASAELDELRPDAAHDHALRHLLTPPLVVVGGPANAGKSTLVNTLAGRDVSVVDERAGTTRDHVGVAVEVDGLRVVLVDLPGTRGGADRVEQAAALLAERVVERASLFLLAHAPGQSPSIPPPSLRADSCVVRVLLQSDRASESDRESTPVAVSARTGDRMADLAVMIRSRLVPDEVLLSSRPWRFHPALTSGAGRSVTAP